MRTFATVIFLLLVTMAFKPPSTEMRRAAVGDLGSLPPLLKRAFAPDSPDFQPIANPGPRDWLAVHQESGQTFDDFLALRSNRPTSVRRIIYLQPLGEFPPEDSPSFVKLCEFAAAFFVHEAGDRRRSVVRARTHSTSPTSIVTYTDESVRSWGPARNAGA